MLLCSPSLSLPLDQSGWEAPPCRPISFSVQNPARTKLCANDDLQRDALKRAKCRRIYEEHASGKTTVRPDIRKLPDGNFSGLGLQPLSDLKPDHSIANTTREIWVIISRFGLFIHQSLLSQIGKRQLAY
jgi:hypothetical protein